MKYESLACTKDDIKRLKDIERDLSCGLDIYLQDALLWELHVGVIQQGALYNKELELALDNMEGTA